MIRLPQLVYLGVAALCTGIVFSCTSCTNPVPTSEKTDEESNNPILVGVEGLFKGYRDSPSMADKAWTGKRIHLTLAKKDYAIVNGQILWHASFPVVAPAIIFSCVNPPKDNENTITITGLCKGRVKDGKKHDGGLLYYIKVTDGFVVTYP